VGIGRGLFGFFVVVKELEVKMRSIILSFVCVWAISFVCVLCVNGQDVTDEVGSSALELPPLNVDDGITVDVVQPDEADGNENVLSIAEDTAVKNETSANIVDESSVSNPAATTEANEKDSEEDGVSRSSWSDWNNKFSPQNGNAPVPQGSLPAPPPNAYDQSYTNQYANTTQVDEKPVPYLMWHRDPWTHRLSLAPYAPGYAAAPQDFIVPPSDFSLWLTGFPSHGHHWRQPKYLGYYDPMPEIVSATPSRRQMILGYPNTPQTQYRDPYTGQALPYNPAINPEAILPVRESLIERWRRRSLARRSAPLGQFPGQPPALSQPIQSPLFGQPYGQPVGQINQPENTFQNQTEQFQFQQQFNQQFQEQPRYTRRPVGRFRQGLRERVQRLGIFEALTRGRTGYATTNNPNAEYGEAPAYNGSN
jgi:hypothetical protein